MSIGVVRQELQYFNAGAAGSVSGPITILAGSLIQAVAFVNSTTTVTSINDGSNTFATIDTLTDATASRYYRHAYFYYSGAGTYTITGAFGASLSSGGLLLKEITGLTATPLDGHNKNNQATPGTGANGVVSGTATNTNRAFMSFFCHNSQNTTQPTMGNNFSYTTGAHGSDTGGSDGGCFANGSVDPGSTGSAIQAQLTAASNVSHNTFMALFDEASVASTLTAALGSFSLTGAPGATDSAIPAQQGSLALTGKPVTFSTTSIPVLTVPNVVGLTQANAIIAMQASGYNLMLISPVFSVPIASGVIAGQYPAGGAIALTTVIQNLFVSLGPSTVHEGLLI